MQDDQQMHEHDHRNIGRDLDLFHMQEEAAGSVFWHERGYALFRAVENFIRSKLDRNGYGEVKTPQLYTKELFEDSGHWEHYRDKMFLTGTEVEEGTPIRLGPHMVQEVDDHVVPTHAFKAMNCPGHVQIFKNGAPSYRQLPWRMAEFGCCHRNEPSGSLHGIMRVRQFTQDDAHIFCTLDQIEGEIKEFCLLLLDVYKTFGFDDVKVGFSTRPDEFAGDEASWDIAEAALMAGAEAAGLSYVIQEGDGAFYGPKLEFALTDKKGRSWQCGTIQLDFVLPESLDANYRGSDGDLHRPVMLHRAILGSLERFIGILLEHYEGVLPTWLAPTQAVVMNIKPDPEAIAYAKKTHSELLSRGVRAILDLRDENVSQKVKEHSQMVIPYIIAVGGREAADHTLSVREFGKTKAAVANYAHAIDVIASASQP